MQLMRRPFFFFSSLNKGGGRTTEQGGVKIAFRLLRALFGLNTKKGGAGEAEAGNHPRAEGGEAEGLKRTKSG